jgi:hypothetical protein
MPADATKYNAPCQQNPDSGRIAALRAAPFAGLRAPTAMKLNCPLCGETLQYDRSVAGRSGQCSYCENVIRMPAVEELPEELREELRREEAKQQQKEKRKYQRKQEQFLKEIQKEEKLKLKEEARKKQEELDQKIQAARKPVPEELAVRKRYRALRVLAAWNKVLAGLILLGYLGYVIFDVVAALRGQTLWPLVFFMALVWAIPTLFALITVWASGELLRVLLDIADDVRITRLLTKKQVYRDDDAKEH